VRRKVPFRAILRSEWTKLRSVRATWWCTGMYLLLVGGMGWLAAASTDRAPDSGVAVSAALTGFGVGQFLLVVLGVLSVTSEFSSGMALVSLTAVPRRTRLLVAKTLVVGAWCALLTLVLVGVCALAARTLTDVPGGIVLQDPGVLRSLGLQVAAAALTGVLAVGLGAVLRSTAGAIGAGLALVVVLPPAFALAGGTWPPRVSAALPALRVGSDAFLAESTTWQVGMAVIAAWAVGAWVLGAILLERRDV
jgi:ABC-type transport system involved in multi-copper enzyme maturation permease subunit